VAVAPGAAVGGEIARFAEQFREERAQRWDGAEDDDAPQLSATPDHKVAEGIGDVDTAGEGLDVVGPESDRDRRAVQD